MTLSNSKNFKGLDNPKDSPRSVMCFGTFDLLHPGHLNYFQQAKKHGNHLIVVLARDKTKKQQNKSVLFKEKERIKIIQNLSIVDEAVLGDLKDKLKVIKDKQPNIICLGYDQEADENELRKKFPSIQIKRMNPYQEKKYKSSLLKKI